MADTLQTLALIILAQTYRGNTVRQANRQAAALKCLKWQEGAGQNVAFVPKGTGVVAEMYSEGADATNFGSDVQLKALLPWASGRGNFHVSGLAQATAGTSADPLGNIPLWASNMGDAAAALASLLNQQVYTGNGTPPNLVGLGVAIGTQNNTYAGIDRSANTFFNPYLFSTAAALSFAAIRTDLAAIYTACGKRPDLALVNPSILVGLSSLFDPQKQYQFQVVREGELARGKVEFEGGIGAIKFDGCLFVEDKDAPDGQIAYLNTDHVRIEYLPLDLSTVPGMDDEVMDLFADDGFGITPLGMRLEMLAKTGDSDKCEMKSYLQLVVDRPNACGMRTNITGA